MLNPFISMQMNKSQLQVKEHITHKQFMQLYEKTLTKYKSISNIGVVVVLLFIIGWVG